MRYDSDAATWGNPANKLVGTYERELGPLWRELDRLPPRLVFDIGAAEGYYAVGSAVRWPGCTVLAWEADSDSRRALAAHVALNHVVDRVRIRGMCEIDELCAELGALPVDLVIVDVEGAELHLCAAAAIERGRNAVWVVETHDEEGARELADRFALTHEVEIIADEPRCAADCPAFVPWYCRLLSYDRWRIVSEGRPFPTPWLIARPRRERLGL